jgi:hypothetical protein
MTTDNKLSDEEIRQISFYDLFNELDTCDTLGGPKTGWCKDQVRTKMDTGFNWTANISMG